MRGALVTALSAFLMWLYFEFAASSLPPGILLHFVIVPAAFGVAAYFSLHGASGTYVWQVLLPLVVPLSPILLIEGDPAKPGLEWILYWPLVLAIFAGEVVAWGVKKLLDRNNERAQA